MDVEVVDDHVDNLAGGDLSVEEVQGGDLLLTAPPLADLADDLPGVDVEGSQQARSSVTNVVDRTSGQLAPSSQGQVGEQRWSTRRQVFSSKDQTGPSLGRFT